MTNPTFAGAARWLPVFAVAALFPAAALAQNTNVLPPIDVTGTPTNQEAVYTTPAAISTISQQEINVLSRLDAVIRAQPGVFTRETLSNTGYAISIRGFEGSGRVNMMIDGVTQNFRFTGHDAQGFTYVDSQLLAGIDIERGAVAGTGGTGALAGTVNFRTIDVDDVLQPGRNFGALTSLTWGSNGIGWREMLAGAAKLSPNFSIMGAFAYRNEDSYKNGDGTPIQFAGPQNLGSGLIKINTAPTENSTLRFGYRHYDNDFVASSVLQNILNQTFTVNYAYNPHDNLIDLKVNLGFNNTEMQYIRRVNPFVSAVTASTRNMKDRGITFNTSNTSRFNFGTFTVKTETGVEVVSDEFLAFNGGVNPTGDSHAAGLFNKTTFSRGIFDLIVGLRYDLYSINGAGEVGVGGGPLPAGPYTVDDQDGRFNPNITLAAQVLPAVQLYGKYAESFRHPTVHELLLGGNHPGSVTGSMVPNPFLRPETKKGFELGANVVRDALLMPGDALRLKLAYFHDNVDNYIVACSVPTGLPFPPGPTAVNFFCNAAGTSQVNGFELQGSYDTGRWFTTFNYTYLNTDLPTQTPGLGASQYLPDHSGQVSFGMRYLDQRLTAGVRARLYSSAADPTYDPTLQVQRPGYQLVDLFGSYKLTPTWTLTATVENLLDEAYTPITGTPPSTTTGFSPTFPTGRGRTILVNSRTQF